MHVFHGYIIIIAFSKIQNVNDLITSVSQITFLLKGNARKLCTTRQDNL